MPAVLPKFSFPVLANKSGQAFGSAEELLAKLGSESSGQFLVGRQGMWHGGIHITEETIPWCALSTNSEAEKAFYNNQPYKGEQFVRCMADGEIVAYRVCKDYDSAAISWNNAQLHMSNSFVLVKHYIQLGETAASGLTFYTLYMNLAPFSAYAQSGGELTRKVVKAQKFYMSAEDVTAKPANSAGMLSAGILVTLSDNIISRASDNRQFTEVTLVAETKNAAGTMLAAGTKIWTVSDRGSLASSASAPKPSWWVKCAPAYGAQSGVQISAVLRTGVKYYLSSDDVQKGISPGELTEGFPLSYEPDNAAQQTTRAIMKPGINPPEPSGALNTFSLATLGKDVGKLKKGDRVWVVSDADYQTPSTPTASGAQPTFDGVVKPATAISISAGDSIGHLGFYELPTDNGKRSRYQVHIECLSMDDVAKFIGNPENVGTDKPAFLKFKPGLKLFDKNEAGQITASERQTKSDGIVTLAKVPVVKEGDQPKYYQIRQEGGWIASADAQLISQYALAERGFAVLNKSSASFDLIDGKLQPDNIVKEILQQLEAAAKADNRPGYALNQYNYQRLLAKIDSNNDGTYSIDEYLQALNNVSYRDRLQRIIAKHPSEWYYGKDDPMWKTYLDTLTGEHSKWKTYLETFIEKVTWMKQVTGMGPEPWHMHPIVLIDSLTQKTSGSISCSTCQSGIEISPELLIHCFGISTEQAELYAPLMTTSFAKYEIDNCLRISHFLGQIGVETQMLTKLREGFYYKDGDRLWKIYYTQLNLGLSKRFPSYTEAQRKQYTKDHLVRNEDELAKTLFPSDFDGMDYRGRGLIHLTHEGTYKSYKDYSGNDVVSNPKLLESSPSLAVDSACWFWSKFAKINTLADSDNLSALTYKVNTARLDMAKRGVIQKNALDYLKKKITRCVK
jgi:predicted chitinase